MCRWRIGHELLSLCHYFPSIQKIMSENGRVKFLSILFRSTHKILRTYSPSSPVTKATWLRLIRFSRTRRRSRAPISMHKKHSRVEVFFHAVEMGRIELPSELGCHHESTVRRLSQDLSLTGMRQTESCNADP